MAIEIPNIVEAAASFGVTVGANVFRSFGRGFLALGIYNGVGDYTVILERPVADKLIFVTASIAANPVAARITTNVDLTLIGVNFDAEVTAFNLLVLNTPNGA